MRYSGIFIFFCVLILIVCSAGVGFIFYLQNPTRYYNKGVSSFESGNYEQSIESLNEYISYGFENEKTAKAKYYLAEAIDRKTASVNPAMGENADRVMKEKDALAMRRFIDVINNNARKDYQVEAIIGYAEICRRNQRYDRFITTKLEDAIHAYPDKKIDDQIWTLLGYQYLFAGDARKAMNGFLQSASELSKLGQAQAHIKLEQYESAFRIYEDFFNFFPSSRYIKEVEMSYLNEISAYAKLFQDNKKFVEAIQFYRRVIDFFPKTPDAENARYQIGECYYGLENYNEALRYYTAAFEDRTNLKDEDALYKMGLSYYELGKNVEAYKTFNLLINQYPNSIYQTRARQWVKQLKKDLEYFQE